MRTFYITTPIYYPNARPHVGSAYTTIVCDVLARYKRMCGYDVAFLTGTDEHGEKLERSAEAAGQSPSQFVAEKRKLFVQLWEKLGIPVSVYGGTATHGCAGTGKSACATPDGKPDSLRFIYTTHPDHEKSVQRMLRLAQKNSPGVIYKGQYQGRYCVSDERYIADGSDPVNCDICGRPAELISEENYFFKLSAFQNRLLELYEKHPEFVQPEYRRNEVKSFVKGGLRDISVSRKRLKWGIPWPDDPEQVFYVWYDALTSYMTGIGYAQGENGNEEFRKYWRNKPGESEIVHMLGKDILRFHAVYWPAFIMAAYPDQPEMLPSTVFAHGWIYYEQDKMSKSKGNVVYPEPIVDALDSFGAPGNDALRYYLLREAPFGQDTSFSYEGLIQRYNSDLANGLGNLASRVLAMVHQYFESRVPQPSPSHSDSPANALRTVARPNIWAAVGNQDARELGQYNELKFSDALQTIWRLISRVDAYLVQRKPWVLARNPDQRQELADVLYDACEALRVILILAHPVMPNATAQIWVQMGQNTLLGEQQFDCLDWGQLAPGTALGRVVGVFPRLETATTLAKLDEFAEADRNRDTRMGAFIKPEAKVDDRSPQSPVRNKPKEAFIPVQTEKTPEATPTPAPEPRAPSPQPPPPTLISIEDFAKVDMRVGEVKSAERVPGATKLLKLLVDIGSEVRQVVAGIAEYYEPEKLIGMKVVLVTNLQPRKLRGVESNGMIVAASVGEQGRPVLVTFKEEVENGARLK
jgi:methionyl-tRNA synthetase